MVSWIVVVLLCYFTTNVQSLKCCTNPQCSETCTATPIIGACRRTIDTSPSPSHNEPEKYVRYIANGCDNGGQKIAYYDRDYPSGYGWLQSTRWPSRALLCDKADLCNKEPFEIEVCKWPKIPTDLLDLECSCSELGMTKTELGSYLLGKDIKYDQLCKNNVCKFREIYNGLSDDLRKTIKWPRATCVYVNGSNYNWNGAYGCSAEVKDDGHSNEDPLNINRNVGYRNTQNGRQIDIWCQHGESAEGKYCNDESYYINLDTVMKCPKT